MEQQQHILDRMDTRLFAAIMVLGIPTGKVHHAGIGWIQVNLSTAVQWQSLFRWYYYDQSASQECHCTVLSWGILCPETVWLKVRWQGQFKKASTEHTASIQVRLLISLPTERRWISLMMRNFRIHESMVHMVAFLGVAGWLLYCLRMMYLVAIPCDHHGSGMYDHDPLETFAETPTII